MLTHDSELDWRMIVLGKKRSIHFMLWMVQGEMFWNSTNIEDNSDKLCLTLDYKTEYGVLVVSMSANEYRVLCSCVCYLGTSTSDHNPKTFMLAALITLNPPLVSMWVSMVVCPYARCNWMVTGPRGNTTSHSKPAGIGSSSPTTLWRQAQVKMNG